MLGGGGLGWGGGVTLAYWRWSVRGEAGRRWKAEEGAKAAARPRVLSARKAVVTRILL